MKETYTVTGMTCAACSARVEKSVAALPGTKDVSVNLLKNSMVVEYDEAKLSSAEIVQAVTKAGYGAALRDAAKAGKAPSPAEAARQEYLAMKRRMTGSFLFAIPLFYLSMGRMMGWPMPEAFLGDSRAMVCALTELFLLIPILFLNRRYFQQGFKTLVHGSPNMDSLVALGAGASTVYGVYALYKIAIALGTGDLAEAAHFSHELYFEGAGTILTLITVGKFLEARAKGRTSQAVNELLDLAPKTASVIRDGKEVTIPAEELVPGDLIAVRAGESIPADGVIVEGTASIDESAITGESIPAEKRPGDTVIGATVNRSGYFRMTASKVGSDTALAQIIRLVDEATGSKAPIARLADKVAGIFVPAVIAIALLAAAVWLLLGASAEFALTIAVSVLVVSCPCALGLATPTAIMVGAGWGARHGILFKSAEALEAAHDVQTAVLDKTGTITRGAPSVTDILCAAGVSEDELLRAAASLEHLSSHPLAAAVAEKAAATKTSLLPVTDFEEIPGQGIRGVIGGKECLGGSLRMMEAFSIPAEALAAEGARLEEEGKTPLWFASGGRLLGLIAAADTVKPTSRRAVESLRALGIETVMLTGDRRKTAEAIQKEVGTDRVIAEVLPQDKEREIRRIRESGKKAAMIGDGINDAPALARADVGIAVGAGTDIAMESAGIVLMRSDLLDAAAAIELSRAVIRNIKQNLFWAFFYNACGIPIAAGCFYAAFGLKMNPMVAALAMSFSSVFVVTNALRLRFFRPKYALPESGGAPISALPSEETNPSHSDSAKGGNTMKKIVSVEGMMCQHCAAHVKKALESVPGVAAAEVSLEAKEATVALSADVSDEVLSAAVKDAGYTVTGIRNEG